MSFSAELMALDTRVRDWLTLLCQGTSRASFRTEKRGACLLKLYRMFLRERESE